MTDGEVSVKRIFDICVDLHMIYMLRMHWPFVMFLGRKKYTEGDQSIIADLPLFVQAGKILVLTDSDHLLT